MKKILLNTTLRDMLSPMRATSLRKATSPNIAARGVTGRRMSGTGSSRSGLTRGSTYSRLKAQD
ncbi:MAG: hypothetical protein H8D56_23975 [Planctomycetes bacterium]|nr:hypothetical protein [Planctomycetota bacterium]MBL7146081.1 hypothetical protein [Phycisphaerae bacterium]